MPDGPGRSSVQKVLTKVLRLESNGNLRERLRSISKSSRHDQREPKAFKGSWHESMNICSDLKVTRDELARSSLTTAASEKQRRCVVDEAMVRDHRDFHYGKTIVIKRTYTTKHGAKATMDTEILSTGKP